MKRNTIPVLFLKFLLLSLVSTVAYVAFSSPFAAALPPMRPEEQTASLLGLLVVNAVDTVIIMLIALRSLLRGPQLALMLAFSMYGVITVMSVIEAWYFGASLGITNAMLPALILPDLMMQPVIAFLSVLVLGKLRKASGGDEAVVEAARVPAPKGAELAVKLSVIAAAYFVLYYGFGLLVAWRNPALRDMYRAEAHPEIFSLPKMFGLQVFRSLLWVAFAWPVIRTLRGGAVSVALVVGLLYALPMNIVHIMPNPFMPDPSVRLSHFIETSTSNFLFGLIVAWLLHRSHSSIRDLFGFFTRKRTASA